MMMMTTTTKINNGRKKKKKIDISPTDWIGLTKVIMIILMIINIVQYNII